MRRMEAVKKLMEDKPDLTLDELKAALAAKKIHVGRTAIFRFLETVGWNYKKNGPCQRANAAGCERGPRGMAEKPAFA